MRSRYAAFALGLGEYLVATLASSHPDLELPREELVRDLSRAKDRQRFLGLRIVRAEGEEVRKLGGLYVLGSERHESRRIDNQLRGRAGRQGRPAPNEA